MAHDVFISHVEEDADVALAIALGLEEKGFSTWCYEVDSSAGVSYLDQVEKAIRQCKAIALVISRDSLGSHEVGTEVEFGHQTRKPFIPILRGIEHVEFQARQPRWRLVLGTATSIRIPAAGIDAILPRVIDGLRKLGVAGSKKPNAGRLVALRDAIQELPPRPDERKRGEPPGPPEPQPTPLRRAYEAAKRWGMIKGWGARWGGHRLLWAVTAIGAVVAALVLIGALVAVLSRDGNGDQGSAGVVTPTPTAPASLVPTGTVSPVATATTPVAGQEGPWPRFWLTLPNIPPDSWSTSVPRGMNVYQTAFVSWQDPAIESWLVDPNSALPDGEYYFYLLRGATADAPSGAKVFVSTIVHRPDWVVGIGSDHGSFAVQGDGIWEGKTQIFPDDIGQSTYTLKMEIRSAENQLLLRASLTISPE